MIRFIRIALQKYKIKTSKNDVIEKERISNTENSYLVSSISKVISRKNSFDTENRLFPFPRNLIVSLLTFVVLVNKTFEIHLYRFSDGPSVRCCAILLVTKVNIKKAVSGWSLKQLNAGHRLCY